MASYIDNIFINARTQDVQAYTPDWNFLNQGQQILSATQKRNFADFAQRYNSIIDGDLTRQDNIDLRDTYKVQANEFVKQVSGADLTDPRNVKAAGAVFTPLVDNKMYIRDIVNTRAVKDAYAKTQSYAKSLNPAERDLYNEDSLKQLNYFLQDFKNASPEEALGMQAPAYTPGINLEKMALNFFNRQQYDVEIEQNTGQWLIKTKGGKLVEGNLAAGLLSEFYGDPLVRQNIVLENQMQKRDFVESNLMNYNGNKTAAEAAFYQQKYSGRLNFVEAEGKKVVDQINGEVEVGNAVMKQLAKGENSDNTPMSDEPLSYREQLERRIQQLSGLNEQIKQENNQTIAASTTKSKASAPYTINIDGKSYTPEQLDAIAFQSKVGAIANRLAMSRFSQTMKDNPYAMEEFKSDLSWRNKERELKYKAFLDAQSVIATTIPAIGDMTDLAVASKELFENTVDNPSEIVAFDQTRIDAVAANTKSAEDQAIKTYLQLNPSESKKSIANLNAQEKGLILKKAEALVKSGSLSKENHALLSSAVRNYDVNFKVAEATNTIVRDNLRVAINAAAKNGDIFPENKETLLKLINTTTDLKKLKEEFVKIRTPQINKKREDVESDQFITRGYNPLVWLTNIIQGTPEVTAGKEFDVLFGDGENYISSAYYKHAKSLDARAAGYSAGVGGVTTFGKDLGVASNTKDGPADLVLNYVNKAVIANGINSYYEGNYGKVKEGTEPVLSNELSRVVQTFTNGINQKQRETTGTLRTANVKVSIDPVSGEQLVYIQPDSKLAESVYGTSDKKTGLVGLAEAQRMVNQGMMIKLPAGSIPSNIIGVQKLTPTQQLFALKGEITIGGDMSADKGLIKISKNSSGSFDVIGSRYENGKVVALGQDFEDIINTEYRSIVQQKNAGLAVDPDMYLIAKIEQYLKEL